MRGAEREALEVIAAKADLDEADEYLTLAYRTGAVGADALQAVERFAACRAAFETRVERYLFAHTT